MTRKQSKFRVDATFVVFQGSVPSRAEEAAAWQSSKDPFYINTAAIWDQVGFQELGWEGKNTCSCS